MGRVGGEGWEMMTSKSPRANVCLAGWKGG